MELNWDDSKPAKGNRSLKPMGWGAFCLLTAALCLWVFVYASGIYPYLGEGRVDNRSAPATQTDIASFDLGLSMMVLFKGQTAFFEYDVTSPQSEITFDLRPATHIGYTDRRQRIAGVGTGKVEFPVTNTGLYVFRHEPALGRLHGHTKYTVSWGAR